MNFKGIMFVNVSLEYFVRIAGDFRIGVLLLINVTFRVTFKYCSVLW